MSVSSPPTRELAHRPTEAGTLLRMWRTRRGLSQLRLALVASVSARHVSFIESGRSEPGRDVLIRLGRALELPLIELNRVLVAGRFAPMHPERSFDDPDLGAVRDTLRFLLKQHEPNGAVVIDDVWNVLLCNDAHRRIIELFAPGGEIAAHGRGRPMNLMRAVFDPRALRMVIANFAVVAPLLRQRVVGVVESLPGDRRPQELLADIDRFNAECGPMPPSSATPSGIVLPLILERGEYRLSLITTATRFSAPIDATVEGLQLETFFPLDDSSQRLLERLAAGS